MRRVLAFLFGVVAYVVFLATFLYAVAFVGGFAVPRTVDGGGPAADPARALLVNSGLLLLFAVQHSGMARQGFKRLWTRVVAPSVERSAYVLTASAVLALLFWQWRPMPRVVWGVEAPAGRVTLWGFFGLGWALVLASTFLINHFDLFGLRQVWLRFKERPYRPPRFQTRLFYNYVRHPLLLGFLIAFWATPRMTLGHLLFAVTTTAYILVAIQLEERDLLGLHGAAYRRYREMTPMLVPRPGRMADGAELARLDAVAGRDAGEGTPAGG